MTKMIQTELICLIIALNTGKLTGLAITEIILTSAFLASVVVIRQWRLLLCGALFFISGLGNCTLTLPIFSQVPALGTVSAILAGFLIVLPFKPARTWNLWAKVGKINIQTFGIIIGISIISVFSLAAWAKWTDNLGIAVNMAEGVLHYPVWIVAVLLIPCFALLNSLAEEIVYRGVLQTALSEGFTNCHLVIALQATAFASLHFAAGFPNGLTGYAMTFIYGAVLGYLRKHTNGMLSPILCHIVADMAIFYYMANYVLSF